MKATRTLTSVGKNRYLKVGMRLEFTIASKLFKQQKSVGKPLNVNERQFSAKVTAESDYYLISATLNTIKAAFTESLRVPIIFT